MNFPSFLSKAMNFDGWKLLAPSSRKASPVGTATHCPLDMVVVEGLKQS